MGKQKTWSTSVAVWLFGIASSFAACGGGSSTNPGGNGGTGGTSTLPPGTGICADTCTKDCNQDQDCDMSQGEMCCNLASAGKT